MRKQIKNNTKEFRHNYRTNRMTRLIRQVHNTNRLRKQTKDIAIQTQHYTKQFRHNTTT